MPEKNPKSVQVDGPAHTKVLALAEALGLTQLAAASVLIRVADARVALDTLQKTGRERLAALAESSKAAAPAPGTTGGRAAAQPAAGGHDQTHRSTK